MLPTLEWVNGFVLSITRATGVTVTSHIEKTVNPLVFRVRLRFAEPLSGKSMMLVWNLFQMYAKKNESIPQGKKPEKSLELVAEVVVKRRLGPARNENPAE